MTYDRMRFDFLVRCAAVVMAGAMVASCTSTSLEDAMPGAQNTGAYPNLNIAPVSQTSQFSDDDERSGVSQLEAARARIQAQANTPAASDAERLRKVGASHGEDALRIIEQ